MSNTNSVTLTTTEAKLQRKIEALAKTVLEQEKAIAAMKRGNQLGSAVLLRAKPREDFPKREFFNLHGSILVDREMYARGEQEFAKGGDMIQLDFSMSESNFYKQDPSDPMGDKNANAFRVETDSQFAVEWLSEHVARDASTAYDMQAPPVDRDVSVGQRARKAG